MEEKTLIEDILTDQNDSEKKYDINDAYQTLDRVNFWLNNFDSKASYLLATIGIIGTILFTSDFFECINLVSWGNLYAFISNLLFLLILVSFIVSLYFLILTIKPRVENIEPCKPEEHTVLFYGSISGMKQRFNEIKKVTDFSKETIIDDINNQSYVCSTICMKKKKNISTACSWIVVCMSALIIFEILKHIF